VLFLCPLLALTFLATHIIFPDKSEEISIDSRPLGPAPQSEIDAIVSKLKSHKHLYEATFTQNDKLPTALGPGRNDFCILFRFKVPVSL
jgi:hypothetical protein